MSQTSLPGDGLPRSDDTLTPEQVAQMIKAEADCAACVSPCADYMLSDSQRTAVEQVRSNITKDEPLYGSANGHIFHILLCSGVSSTRWPSKIESVEDSYAAQASATISGLEEEFDMDIRLSVISRASDNGVDPEYECDIIIFPACKKYRAVRADQLASVLRKEIASFTGKTVDSTAGDEDTKSDQHEVIDLAGRSRVLICGHKLRDRRCGLIAPVLEHVFGMELDARGLRDTVDIDIVSHVGGHKYAGNVIVHTTDKTLGSVWYGRVFPEHVAAIVEETIVNKRIVKPLYRGSTYDW